MKRIFLSIIMAGLFLTSHAATHIIVERLADTPIQIDLMTVQTLKFFNGNKISFNLKNGNSQNVDQVRSLIFSELSTAIEDVKFETNISVYPNPTVDALMVNGVQENSKMVVYSMNGIMILSQTAQDGINKIDVSNLPNGMYLLHMDTETFKFTKE